MTSTWWLDVAVRAPATQVERARHAVDQRDHVDREGRLQRRELEQVVEHDVGVGVALERDDEAGLAAGRVVVDVGDAVEVAAVDELLRCAPAIAEQLVWYGSSVTTISVAAALALLDRRPWPAS